MLLIKRYIYPDAHVGQLWTVVTDADILQKHTASRTYWWCLAPSWRQSFGITTRDPVTSEHAPARARTFHNFTSQEPYLYMGPQPRLYGWMSHHAVQVYSDGSGLKHEDDALDARTITVVSDVGCNIRAALQDVHVRAIACVLRPTGSGRTQIKFLPFIRPSLPWVRK